MLANTEKLTFKARLRIEYFPNIMLNYFIIRKNYDSGGQTLKSELFKGSLRYKKWKVLRNILRHANQTCCSFFNLNQTRHFLDSDSYYKNLI